MTQQAVFVDLDGTLVHLDVPYEELTEATLNAHLGTSRPEWVETYSEVFFDAFDALEPHPFRKGMEAVLEMAGRDADPAELVDTLRQKECQALTVDADAKAALEALETNAALGVLTNGVRHWQRAKLAHVGLAAHFDTLVTSYEAGAHKPARAPFHLAEQRLPAEEYVLLGDADSDVDGARAADWDWLQYGDRTDASSFWSRARRLTNA